MKANLATCGVVIVLAASTLWAKACWEADQSLTLAQSYDAQMDPFSRSAHLTFAAQQVAPGSAAAAAQAELESASAPPFQRFLNHAGTQAAASGSRHLFRPTGLVRTPPPGNAAAPEPGQPTSPVVTLAAEGPNVVASVLTSLFLFLWIFLAALWAWRGHDRSGAPTGARWSLAGGTLACLACWLATAWFV